MAKRGLGSANQSTRKRVAQAGGRASHGGGRKKKGEFSQNEEFYSEINKDDEVKKIPNKSSGMGALGGISGADSDQIKDEDLNGDIIGSKEDSLK